MTEAGKYADPGVSEYFNLQQSSYIYYCTAFDEFSGELLIGLVNKVNLMESSFMKKLSLCIHKTDVSVKNIECTRLNTHKMIIGLF